MKNLRPEEIELKSFEIITSKMDKDRLEFYSDSELKVVKRVIHTTADFDYQNNIVFQNNALDTLKDYIRREAMIFTDTNMAFTGINKKLADECGIDPFCLISDNEVVEIAQKKGITRASAAVDMAYDMHISFNQDRKEAGEKDVPIVFAVGNAPTAILRIFELMEETGVKPDFIIAAPVGFVNVLEAKELVKESNIPAIICEGNKGGSNVCAAIINAILKELRDEIYMEKKA